MCHQSKSLYNQNLCPKHFYQHASWITNACQIQSDGVFARVSLLYRLSEPLQTPPQMIVLFEKAVQHQLHCQEKFKSLQNSNANFPQTHSW